MQKKEGSIAHFVDYSSCKDPLENITKRVQYHPSISVIKEKKSGLMFDFNTTMTEDFVKIIDHRGSFLEKSYEDNTKESH